MNSFKFLYILPKQQLKMQLAMSLVYNKATNFMLPSSGIYYQFFKNFTNLAILNALAKIKASTFFDSYIFYVSPVVDTIIINCKDFF